MVDPDTMLCIVGLICLVTVVACMIVAAGKNEDNPPEDD